MLLLFILNKNKFLSKRRAALKAALSFFIIVMIFSGLALAADRDVIIGYSKPVGVSEEQHIHGYGGKVKKDFHIINAISARLPENKIEEMKNDPSIKYVVNDTIFKVSDEYSNSWGVQYIGSQAVHNQSINGTGVKIAVLDTGIDYTHPDLAGNYKGGYNFISDNSDPWDDNCLSVYKTCHGTHVSGIIAAESNGIGVVGVAPGASIYAVKVLDGGGFGAASFVVSGIEWAKNNGMNIISMSLESYENNTAVLDAVNAAYDSGILLIAAAGNTKGGPVLYPAAYDSVIAVTAIDQNGQRASFSPIGQKIEVAAPGVAINSTVNGGYGLLSGTSMAAPHVTGVAALIYSTNFPDVNGDGIQDNKDVRQIIDNTAFDAGIAGKDDTYGYGIVDASKAVLGISAYAIPADVDADLSITEDDGVSEIIAGDGSIYTYNIRVANEGPSDASDVKVYDNWPSGFIKVGVITSQGTCDTETNSPSFTCDLGTIAKDGAATIAVEYAVPSTTPPDNYINRIDATSTTPDQNLDNNAANDTNVVYARLMLTNSGGSKNVDAKNISLAPGDYQISITNINLSELEMNVFENGIFQKNLSTEFEFKGPGVRTVELVGDYTLEIKIIPDGKRNSTGYVTIRRLS